MQGKVKEEVRWKGKGKK